MSKKNKQKRIILLSLLSVIAAPLLGGLIYYKGQFPNDFFEFPPLEISPKPGFSWPVFIGLAGAILFVIVLYLYPWIFGFKRPNQKEKSQNKGKLPIWFWLGMIMSIVDGVFLFTPINSAVFVLNCGYVPIIWGIVLMTDGWVLQRTGTSILKDRPKNMLWMILCSAFAWGFFEYLSFFIELNWYYPEGNRISVWAFYVYAFIGGGCLVPFALEMYMLLKSFKGLALRYSYGPRISLSRNVQYIILIVSLASLFAISYFPYILFPMLWLSPVIVLSIALDLAGIWTPFKPVAKEGNWTPLALVALGEIIIGILHEGANYLSAIHDPFSTIVPGYWVYSIPYVEKFYLFEMPIEGIFGYLPYGIYNWVAWIGFAYLLNIKTIFDKE